MYKIKISKSIIVDNLKSDDFIGYQHKVRKQQEGLLDEFIKDKSNIFSINLNNGVDPFMDFINLHPLDEQYKCGEYIIKFYEMSKLGFPVFTINDIDLDYELSKVEEFILENGITSSIGLKYNLPGVKLKNMNTWSNSDYIIGDGNYFDTNHIDRIIDNILSDSNVSLISVIDESGIEFQYNNQPNFLKILKREFRLKKLLSE